MNKTYITLYAPDGKTTTYNDVKSWGVHEKGFLIIAPNADEQQWAGVSVTTTLPFRITKEAD